MGEYTGGMGAGNGRFEGMSTFHLVLLREEEDVADDSLPKRQKKINSHNASEHNCMVSTDLYCSTARQGKSL
jgi:hypothetical protein